MDLFYKGHEIFRPIDVLVHAFERLALRSDFVF
jgi:hypothetical protein